MNRKNNGEGSVRRHPDCVTEVRMGNTILTVSGFFERDAIETAADKMAKIITAEGTLTRCLARSDDI